MYIAVLIRFIILMLHNFLVIFPMVLHMHDGLGCRGNGGYMFFQHTSPVRILFV